MTERLEVLIEGLREDVHEIKDQLRDGMNVHTDFASRLAVVEAQLRTAKWLIGTITTLLGGSVAAALLMHLVN